MKRLPNIILRVGANATILSVNASATTFFDTPAENLSGAHLWTLLATDFDPENIIDVRASFEKRRSESWVILSKSLSRWMQLDLMADGAESVLILSILANHLVDQASLDRAFEARLSAAEQRFRALIETTDDFYYCIDAESGQMTFASQSYEHIWGRSRESLYGEAQSALEHVLPEDRAAIANVIPIQANQSNFEVEYRIRRPDGEIRWLWDRGYVVRDAIGRASLYVGIASDVTERKALQARLFREERLELIGRITAELAHDFNNILGAVRLLAHVSKAKADLHNLKIHEVEKIITVLEQGDGVVRSLLAVVGKEDLLPQTLNLQDLIDDLAPLIDTTLGSGIFFSVFHGARDARVRIDPSSFGRTILNLAINARDALAGSGICRLSTRYVRLHESHPQARAGHAAPGVFACVAFSDDGPGMNEEVLSEALQPFFTTKPHGAGLGLASVAGFARQSGGFVEIRSQPGSGATIRVFLPCLPEESVVEIHNNTRAPSAAKLLLVDDDERFRDALGMFLSDKGMSVTSCIDGCDALAAALKSDFDLIITDMRMPGMSGLELAQRLHALEVQTPILILSGYAGDFPASANAAPPALSKMRPLSDIFARIVSMLRTEHFSDNEARPANNQLQNE